MENSNSNAQEKRRFKPIHLVIIFLVLTISFGSVFLIGKNFLQANNDSRKSDVLGPLYVTPEFTVNLANTNGRRYLRAQLSIEVDDKRVLKELDNKKPVLQDTVIAILSHQTITDLDSQEGKENIKVLLQENINSFLVTGEVVNIYYNHFVWQ